jgi:N-acetylglucosamine-6-sulfatase
MESEQPDNRARPRSAYSVRPNVVRAVWGKLFDRSGGRTRLAIFVLLACVSVGVGVVSASQRNGSGSPTPVARHAPARDPGRPNIVFVLTDDLSMNLLQFMPHVQELMRQGMTFNNYFVSDSLCCPSRASIFTGNFPHNTRIFGNFGRQGGFGLFHARREERDSFNIALHRAGYETAMMGKYLNGYLERPEIPDTYVPPGWSEWDVAGDGYPEFNYVLNRNGSLYAYGNQPADYLTDVIANRGLSFIDRATTDNRPFFLELATFAPHQPATPAPRDADRFPGLTAPHPPSWDLLPSNAPLWLANHRALRPAQIEKINRLFRLRAQSVQAVDEMIARLQARLRADGVADNTYIVFSSDNGFHTGEYRLAPGKMTAFDTDIRVPLVVAGPGVPPGTSTDAMSENIDLAETFAAMGGTNFEGDGHSLLPVLSTGRGADWRNAILVEHHGTDIQGGDPDYQQSASGDPRSYEAMRTRDFLYVEYNDGETEFYDTPRDPFELHNLAGRLTFAQLVRLHEELSALEQCRGSTDCWDATRIDRPVVQVRRRRHR